MSLDLYSRKSMELTLTVATIALASKSVDFLSTDEDVLSKPRGMDAPFRVRNHTGFTIQCLGRLAATRMTLRETGRRPGDPMEVRRRRDHE